MTRKIFKNASKLFSANVLSSILGLIFMSMLTRNLELKEYGLFVILIAYSMFIVGIFKINTLEASIKYLSNTTESNKIYNQKIINTAFSIDIYNTILVSVLMLISIGIFKSIYDFFLNDIYFYIFAFVVAFSMITNGLLLAFLRIYNYFNITVTIQIVESIVKVVIGYLLLNIDLFTLENIIILFVLIQVAMNSYLIWILKRKITQNGFCLGLMSIKNLQSSIDELKEFKTFIQNMTFSKWVISVTKKADETVVGSMLGLELVGIYKVIKQITSILSKIIDPIYISMYPELAKAIEKNEIYNIKKTILKIKLISLFVTMIGMLGVVLFGEVVIYKIFNIDISSENMTLNLYFLGISILFVFIYQHPLMLSYHMDKEILRIHIFTSIYFIISLIVGIKTLGLLGTSISFLSYAIIESLIKCIVLKRLNK